MPRPVGSKNKIQASARENVAAVFNRLHGTAGMAEWANANKTEFYKIYSRLIPQELKGELTGADGGPLQVTIRFVTTNSK